jgi:UDP:flavonoid glycosyltransferase YjiC (YdhE family)
MRVLFSCSPGDGHFMPLLRLARATAAGGHDVAFASAPEHHAHVEAAGAQAFAAGIGSLELGRRHAPLHDALDLPSVPIFQRRDLVYRVRFGQVEAPAKLSDLRAVARAWQPDVVVHEPCDLSAPIVAAERGLPSVNHSFGRVVPLTAIVRAAEEVAPLWESVGLEPDALAGLYRGTYVDICPPSLQDEQPPAGTNVQPLRPADGRREQGNGTRPLAYVTLGTMFNDVERFRALLAAFAPVDCEVVMTVGSDVDPSAVGPVPPNAIVRSYVPQAEILPRADVVVAHGGSGSTFGSLAHGCPIVFLPQGADQFENANAVTATGAGVTILPGDVSTAALRQALEGVLGDGSFADAARTLAAEIKAMPSADQAAAKLFAA